MSENNMKSELLGVEKCKSEARQMNHRRKMPKTSIVLNGDRPAATGCAFDSCCSRTQVNMVVAMQDHISCTKTPDFFKGQELDKDSKLSLPYELDHMYANCSENRASKDDGQQLKCVKEWLLLNLDLIQQQQDQLTLKDRELTALRQENEKLKLRLEKSETRLAALQRDHSSDLPNCSSKFASNKACDARRSKKSQLIDRHRKRESSADSSQSKRHSVADGSRDGCISGYGSGNQSKQSQKKALSVQKKDELLQTEILYYTPIGESTKQVDIPKISEPVLVPTWRERHFTSCYQLEGTENLDDDVFLKRHQKLEIDEKRRKRWDIQRLREQRLHEKLKRGRCGTKELCNSPRPELTTFYPNPIDVQFIEVTDSVPIFAFGHAIPLMEPSEFCIPWLNSSNKEWSEMGTSGTGRYIKSRQWNDSRRAT